MCGISLKRHKRNWLRGIWVARSVKCPLWLRSNESGVWVQPGLGFCADSSQPGVCLGFCVSLSLPLPAHALSLSLYLSVSKIKYTLKTFFFKEKKLVTVLAQWPKRSVCLGNKCEREAPDSLDFCARCTYFLFKTKVFNNIKICLIKCVCGIYHVQMLLEPKIK